MKEKRGGFRKDYITEVAEQGPETGWELSPEDWAFPEINWEPLEIDWAEAVINREE